MSLAPLLGLLTVQACSSDASPGGGTSAGGQVGAGGHVGSVGGTQSGLGGAIAAGGSPGSGGSTSFGGSTSSGGSTSFGGSTSSGGGGSTGLGGSPSSGGSTGLGGGTSSGGGGGGASGGSGGGASGDTFAAVATLLGKRCAGSMCHSTGSMQLAFASATGTALHTLLTTKIAAPTPHCQGVTLATAGDTNSPLLQIVMSGGKITCATPKSEMVGPMPNKCTATATASTPACLSPTEIMTISDWISAGAP